MAKKRQNGFVFIVVLMVLLLVASEMLILTTVSNTMLFEADNAYLQACRRNMTLSALAWSRQNLEEQNTQSFTFNKAIELNPADIGLEQASLSVIIEKATDKNAEVEVIARISRARQNLNHRKKYRLVLSF